MSGVYIGDKTVAFISITRADNVQGILEPILEDAQG